MYDKKCSLVDEYGGDFDLEHMKDMLDTEFDELPKEFTNYEQFNKWLND